MSTSHCEICDQLTFFQPSLLFLLLPTYPLLLLQTDALFLASLEDSCATLRLLLFHSLLRELLLLGELLASLCDDGLPELVVVAHHATEALLRLDVVDVSLAMRLDACLLRCLKCSTVARLLFLVVLGKKRALFLTVGALNVIEALGENAHTLVELLLLLLELLNLETHEVVGAEALHVLRER